MARQTGAFRIRGTLYGLTYYKLRGKYYVRQKSSLDRDQVMHDVRFSRSRDCMRRFGMAAQIVKTVYQMLPKKERRHGLFGSLTGFANALLFTGDRPEAVLEVLLWELLGPSAAEQVMQASIAQKAQYILVGAPPRSLFAYPGPAVVQDHPERVWTGAP